MHAVLLTLALFASTANPPAEGFDAAGSDPRAIEIADQVMDAMGGREAWDATHYVAWHFFGNRRHWWDRYSGDFRIEGERADGDVKQAFVLLSNVNTKQGRAFVDGVEVTDPDELKKWMDDAYGMWVNDSYWMFMPYKLKDSGVTLKYLGARQTEDYGNVELLRLTFAGVGLTPENQYDVYVDPTTHLVCAWSYYGKADDEEPRFTMPWKDWRKVGRIMLAANHGRDADWNLRVYEELPASVFRSPEPVTIP